MIRVTVELWPHGSVARKRTLATADIWNDGTGDARTGHYGWRLYNKAGNPMREGTTKNYRRADFSVWWLLTHILQTAFPNSEKTIR